MEEIISAPARSLADRILNVRESECFAPFAPILNIVRSANGSEDRDATAARINDFLLELRQRNVPNEDKVLACQEALRDPEIGSVATLAERLQMERRTLERMCGRYFGFPPKLLLRRQRFLRSLSRYVLEPRESWSRALDVQYFDHALFVHDFRSFMGMTPTEYAKTRHPVLDRIIAQRMADWGVAPQTDMPTVLRYSAAGGDSAG